MSIFPRRHIALILLSVFVLALVSGCSSKGVHMPKHRKRRHCDCPTFSQAVTLPSGHAIVAWVSVAVTDADV